MEIDLFFFFFFFNKHVGAETFITYWWVHTFISPALLHKVVFSPKDNQSAANNGLKCALKGNSVRPEQVLAPHREINTHRENRDVSGWRGSEAERPIFPRLEILRSHRGGGLQSFSHANPGPLSWMSSFTGPALLQSHHIKFVMSFPSMNLWQSGVTSFPSEMGCLQLLRTIMGGWCACGGEGWILICNIIIQISLLLSRAGKDASPAFAFCTIIYGGESGLPPYGCSLNRAAVFLVTLSLTGSPTLASLCLLRTRSRRTVERTPLLFRISWDSPHWW